MKLEHGARIQLTRSEHEGSRAMYEVAIQRGGEQASLLSKSTVRIDGAQLVWSAWEGAEPARWAVRFADQLLRTMAKKHAAAGDWPRRVTRWRQEHD